MHFKAMLLTDGGLIKVAEELPNNACLIPFVLHKILAGTYYSKSWE